MDSKIDRAYFRLRAAQWDYQRRESRMLRWLEMRINDDCYVSWSAGKDSMVVAHATHRLRSDIQLLMVDPGIPMHWTEDDRGRTLAFVESWSVRLFPWDKRQAGAPVDGDEKHYREAVHKSMFRELTAYAQGSGLTRRITGMRAAESPQRRKLLASTRGETAHTLQPIWDWSTDDVWTYLVRHNIPWLSIYDHLGPEARNGLIGKNGLREGRMTYLRRYYPEAFRRAHALFGARDYV